MAARHLANLPPTAGKFPGIEQRHTSFRLVPHGAYVSTLRFKGDFQLARHHLVFLLLASLPAGLLRLRAARDLGPAIGDPALRERVASCLGQGVAPARPVAVAVADGKCAAGVLEPFGLLAAGAAVFAALVRRLGQRAGAAVEAPGDAPGIAAVRFLREGNRAVERAGVRGLSDLGGLILGPVRLQRPAFQHGRICRDTGLQIVLDGASLGVV